MDIVIKKMKTRKAVAPIIATLLLVAIAVVGGIIVFVWASGMFGTTAGIALPNAESLQLIGYDARDTTDLSGITGPAIDNTANQKLQAGEYIVLTVRNDGVADMIFGKVVIMGKEHTWDSDAAGANDAPVADTFEMYSGASGNPATSKGTPTIAPGEDARLAVKIHTSLPSDVSLGRNLQVKIKTETGSIFNYFVVTGQAQ